MSYPVTGWEKHKSELSFAIPLLDKGYVPWHWESEKRSYGPQWKRDTGIRTYYRIVRDDLTRVLTGTNRPILVESDPEDTANTTT